MPYFIEVVSLDCDTPKGVIVSIKAAKFTLSSIEKVFSVDLDFEPQLLYGRTVTKGVLRYADNEVKRVFNALFDGSDDDLESPEKALEQLSKFLANTSDSVWACAHDMETLADLAGEFSYDIGLFPWQKKDFFTLQGLHQAKLEAAKENATEVTPEFLGTPFRTLFEKIEDVRRAAKALGIEHI